VEIYGPEASGKTTLALHVIAEAQKQGGYLYSYFFQSTITYIAFWFLCRIITRIMTFVDVRHLITVIQNFVMNVSLLD